MKFKEIFKPEKKFIIIYLGLIVSLFVFILIYVLGELFRIGILKQNLVPDVYLTQFVVILPGPLLTDVLLLYIFPIIIFYVFYKIAPLTAKAYLKLHKLSYIGRKTPQYGMIELASKRKVSVLIRRSILVGLLSFSIAALIVQANSLTPVLFRALEPGRTIENSVTSYLFLSEAVFLGTFLVTSLALFIFLPIWLLEDTSIVSYRNFPGERKSPTIKSTHFLYQNIIEGFTGFSTILVLYVYITNSLSEVGPGDAAILTPLILIVLPVFVTGLFGISLILYEKYLPKIIQDVQRKLTEFNLPMINVPDFNDLKK